jgi:hypothetical protein
MSMTPPLAWLIVTQYDSALYIYKDLYFQGRALSSFSCEFRLFEIHCWKSLLETISQAESLLYLSSLIKSTCKDLLSVLCQTWTKYSTWFIELKPNTVTWRWQVLFSVGRGSMLDMYLNHSDLGTYSPVLSLTWISYFPFSYTLNPVECKTQGLVISGRLLFHFSPLTLA